MKVFREYLDKKLSDPGFNHLFHDNCAICPTTVRVITAISKSSVSLDGISSLSGVPAKRIKDLEAAEQCCITSVKKLCDYFGIPQPVDCLQTKNKQQ